MDNSGRCLQCSNHVVISFADILEETITFECSGCDWKTIPTRDW